MRCPRCQSTNYFLAAPCPDCGFTGNGRSLEHLSNLTFLLHEMSEWYLPAVHRDPLHHRYEQQRRAVEVDLGLRPPPPTEPEALALRLEQSKRHHLRETLAYWLRQGWVTPNVYNDLYRQLTDEIAQLKTQLEDAPPVPLSLPQSKYLAHRWEEKQYLLVILAQLHETDKMSESIYQRAAAEVTADIERLEVRMGLREPAATQKEPHLFQSRKKDKAPTTAAAAPQIRRPRRPQLTWDQVWESLLSERTLHAILFLGVVLLFGSGVSWVAWNWDTFPPIVQIGFLGGFTALFYGLGWYVQTRLTLRGSGIALTAVASLLVPLDFIAFYLSGGFSPNTWPQVWLLTSVVSLFAYTLTAYLLQAEFFGYLLGMALGSMVLASLQLFGLAASWWPMGITAVSLLLIVAHEFLPDGPEKFRFLARPLAQIALVTAVSVMVVSFAFSFFTGQGTISFALAVAGGWWLGGFTLIVAAHRIQMRSLAWEAALSLPIAMWLTQRVLLYIWHIDSSWYALGWALLAPIYLVAGWWLRRMTNELHQSYGETAVRTGWLLIIVAALWGLTDVHAAAVVHPLLAAEMILVAVLWQDARSLWLTSLLLLIGSGAGQASRGATPAELALPWALLAILHLLAALWLKNLTATRKIVFWPQKSDFWWPLYGGAVMAAGMAVLPPLLLFNQSLLTYAVANWIGINGWLAYLAHRQTEPALQAFLAHRRLRKVKRTLFHWLAALPVLGWVWLLFVNDHLTTPGSISLVYAVLAWGLLWVCLRLRQMQWEYGRPWQVAAHLSNLTALLLCIPQAGETWEATCVILSVAIFYFIAVKLLHEPRVFYLGAVLLPFAYVSSLDWLNLAGYFSFPGLALIVTGYIIAAVWLEQRKQISRRITLPMYRAGLWLTLAMVFYNGWTLLMYTTHVWTGYRGNNEINISLMLSLAFTLQGMGLLVYTWQFNTSKWTYLSIWLITLAGGLFVKVYSHGTGRSAALTALLAIAYILLERRLHLLALTRPKVHFFRKAWRLYQRPLLQTGWIIALAAIFLALIRNLIWLGGHFTQEMWAIVALTLITGLYAIAAPLFHKQRFAWLASGLIIIPWTLFTHLLFGAIGEWFSVSWVILGLILLAVGIRLAQFVGLGKWSWPPLVVAHLLIPYALLWGLTDTAVSTLSLALAVVFYLGATWIDRRFSSRQFEGKGAPTWQSPIASFPLARFLYPATILLPLWATFLLRLLAPHTSLTGFALLVLTFAWPLLAGGRRITRWEPAYRWPLYLVAYGTAVIALLLVLPDRPALIGVLLFNTSLAALSAWIFDEPAWLYPAAVLFPIALAVIQTEIRWDQYHFFGWMLEAVAASYLAVAWLLQRFELRRYAMPLLVMMGLLVPLGLPISILDTTGALISFSMGALVYAIAAGWQRWPIMFHAAVGIAIVPYWAAVNLLQVPVRDYGLAAWPGIAVALLLAHWLDTTWGIEPTAAGEKGSTSFPWHNVNAWAGAIWLRITRWWALALYGTAFMAAAVSSIPSLGTAWRWFVCLGLGTAVYFYALFHFRLRSWLLLAWLWLQFTALAAIRWLGLTDSPAQVALAFIPMTALTLFAGLLVAEVRHEGAPLTINERHWSLHSRGWSRPFFLLLLANIGIGQMLSLFDNGPGLVVTLLHGIMLSILASFWGLSMLAYLALTAGFGAVMQTVAWLDISDHLYPVALAILAAVYGLVGYGLRLWRPEVRAFWSWAGIWERPFYRGGWLVSLFALLLALSKGFSLLPVLVSSMSSRPQLSFNDGQLALMLIRTFFVLGLFYLVAALIEKQPRLSYLALWLLLSSWSFWLLLLQGVRELQLFALPAGMYLLIVGWLEWQRGQNSGSRAMARWIDRAGVVVLLGSAFWQSLGSNGGWYALLMIGEGLLLVWLGSLRRLRRLLYAGVMGVVTAVVGQLVQPLLELNTYVLLLLGALLVGIGVGLERRLESIRELSQEFRARLELWE